MSAQQSLMSFREFFDAVENGDAHAVRKALKIHPEWARKTDRHGFTPLCAAAQRGHAECVRELLPLSDPNQGTPQDDNSPLYLAAWGGHAECVRELLAHCDPNKVNVDHETALNAAATETEGALACVLALIPHIDPKIADRSGETPLMSAAWAGSLESVRALWPLSDPAAQDNLGHDALHWAIHSINGPNWACADFLAASSSEKEAEKLLKKAPKNVRLPHCQALLESKELQNSMKNEGQKTKPAMARAGRRI